MVKIDCHNGKTDPLLNYLVGSARPDTRFVAYKTARFKNQQV